MCVCVCVFFYVSWLHSKPAPHAYHCAHTHAPSDTHISSHIHIHTSSLLFNEAPLFFNERCSRSSLHGPPHYHCLLSLLPYFFFYIYSYLTLLLHFMSSAFLLFILSLQPFMFYVLPLLHLSILSDFYITWFFLLFPLILSCLLIPSQIKWQDVPNYHWARSSANLS